MPDTERKRLPGQQPRGTAGGSGCGAVFAIVFGLPFMAAGVVLALIAQGVIPAQNPDNAPLWVAWCLALLFGGAGVFLSLKGVGALVESARIKGRRERHPHEPWRVDYSWDSSGASHSARSSLPGQLGVLGFMTMLLAPFNYFTFYAPPRPVPLWAQGLVLFFDVVLVLVFVGMVLTVVQQAKYGRSRLAFQSFPFFLSDTLTVRLSTDRSIGRFKKLIFTLRCIEERTETTRSGSKTTVRTVCDQLWADEVALEGGAVHEGHEVTVSFKLPDGDYGTRLAEPPARYWELAVAADTPGLDYAARFLVPVYARP